MHDGPAVVLNIDNTSKFVDDLVKMFSEVPDPDRFEELRSDITNYHTHTAGKDTCLGSMSTMVSILKANDVKKGIKWPVS